MDKSRASPRGGLWSDSDVLGPEIFWQTGLRQRAVLTRLAHGDNHGVSETRDISMDESRRFQPGMGVESQGLRGMNRREKYQTAVMEPSSGRQATSSVIGTDPES